jgi:hypothetical protein
VKRSGRLLKFFITGRLSSTSAVLPTAVFIVVCFDRSSLTLSSTTSPLRLHLQTNSICDVLLFVCLSCSCKYMFSYYLFTSILLFSISSIFELHVVVASIIMFNILKLIIKIMLNFLTHIISRLINLLLTVNVGLASVLRR